MIDFGREVCCSLPVASEKEWLVTNGLGGFAMGTVPGILTRRYHGLLIAALDPPLGRTLLLTKLDETVEYNNQFYPLYINRWFGDADEAGLEEPNGHYHIDRFRLIGTTPHWTFSCADAVIEKRIWMQQGANTTYIQYTLKRASEPLKLYPKAFVNYRDYHQITIAEDWDSRLVHVENGLKITAMEGAQPLYLLSSKGEVYPQSEWHEDYFLSQEEYRGQPDVIEDHLHIADFSVELSPGESVTFVASTKSDPNLDGTAAYASQRAHENKLIQAAEAMHGPLPPTVRQLVVAGDQFVVTRPTPDNPDGHSIIAGYPWFSDWGRDTMISIPGIVLCSGRPELARSILSTYTHYVNQGILPNRFPDKGETPDYNTADATLWYFQAIYTYLKATEDKQFLNDIYLVLQDIISWHERGTRYNIKVDPEDNLLFAGEEGFQLTWMDAKVNGWVVTPRIGKPVEVNALWYNALVCLSHFARMLGYAQDEKIYLQRAEAVRQSFTRFWYSPENYCYDVLNGPDGHDVTLRPNQLLAVGLSFSPLEFEQQKAVVDICTRRLLIPHGLRTLPQDDPNYHGVFGGGQAHRDIAYHQGTAWGWLIGPYVAANLRVYRNPELAYSYLEPALQNLRDHGLGSISEIFDADPPFRPRGCPAQAASVGEFLRAWCMIRKSMQAES